MGNQLFDDVSQWIMALSTLVAGKLNLDEIRLRLSSYVPLLVEEFPNARYFTSESLRYVARHSKWFPSYGELCDLLSACWKQDNRHLLLSAPGGTESREPYPIQPAPDWCAAKETRHFHEKEPPLTRPPVRTVEEQLAILRGENAAQ